MYFTTELSHCAIVSNRNAICYDDGFWRPANLDSWKKFGPFALIGLALILRLYLFLSIGYTADDALITFRYAENLASGHGFVYNAGEKVLGTTAFLHTILIALFVKLGISSFWAACLIAMVADAISGWILLRIFSEAPGPFSWLPACLFLFNPETLQWSLSGMETPVAILLLLCATYLSSRERWNAAFLCGGLAILTRVDGIAVVGSLLVSYLVRYRKLPFRGLALVVLVLIPWAVFGFLYFGSPLPNSAAAKWALASHNTFWTPFQIFGKGFLHLHTYGVFLLIFPLIGTWIIVREKHGLLPLAVWTWGYAIAYSLAAGPMHPWYYTPFYVGLGTLAFFGLWRIAGSRKILVSAFTVAAIPLTVVLTVHKITELDLFERQYRAVNRDAGLWVAQNTKKDAVFAIKDIGYLGYYSSRPILDLAGLVSPQCIPFRARGDFLGPIQSFHPDYFAFSAGQVRNLNLQENELMKSYRLKKSIESEYGAYLIFERTGLEE